MKSRIVGLLLIIFILTACGGGSSSPSVSIPVYLLEPQTYVTNTDEALAAAAKYKRAVAEMTASNQTYVVFVMADDGCILLRNRTLTDIVEPINKFVRLTLDAGKEYLFTTICSDKVVYSGVQATAGKFIAMNGLTGKGVVETNDYHVIAQYPQIFSGAIEDKIPVSEGRDEFIAQVSKLNLEIMQKFDVALQEAAKNQMAYVSVLVPDSECRAVINDDLEHPFSPADGIVELYLPPQTYSIATYCGGHFSNTTINILAGTFSTINGDDGKIINNPTASFIDAYQNKDRFLWIITPKGR